MGEARKDALRIDFDRSIKLEFHGSTLSSDAETIKLRVYLRGAELFSLRWDDPC